jgi:hypothetical protein
MFDATGLLRLYARWRARQLRRLDPAEAQRRTLVALMRRASATRFGRDHRFAALRTPADFRRAVPLRSYDDFWREYWGDAFPRLERVSWPGLIPYFAVSSGTTRDTTKFIPVSRQMNRSNRRAALDLLVHHISARPRSRILGGLNFMLGGSTDLVQRAPGVMSGDLSGIAAKTIPFWAQARTFPPLSLALIADYDVKLDKLARAAADADIRSIGGTPSWLLILFDRMAQVRGAAQLPLRAFWPNLELLIHGGVNFAPYRSRFDELLAGSRAETREVYAASEGFVASSDASPSEGLRLNLDHGLYFEFVPVEELGAAEPTRHWIADAETGVNYAVVLTTCAGLWAYVLGDTVRFVSRDPPRVLITGRTAYMLSAFGEHVIGEELEDAVSRAAASINTAVVDFAVSAVFPEGPGKLGGHLFVVEFVGATPTAERIAAFAQTIDQVLCARNDDYKQHRAGGFGMTDPEILVMPHGGFAAWMKRRGKLGGQNKVPRVINDPALFADLRALAQTYTR